MNSMKSSGLQKLLQILLLFVSFCTVFAADDDIPNTSEYPLAARITAAVFLIPIGLVLCFAGRRMFRFLLFFTGALLFGFIAFLISRSIIDFDNASHIQRIAAYIGIAVSGVLGGCLLVCCMKLGVLVLGGYLGFSIASTIIRAGTIQSNTTQLILTGCLIVTFAAIAFFFSEIIIIIATAFNGSTIFLNGIDMFAKTGYNDFVFKYRADAELSAITGKAWAMLASSVIIGAIGAFVQCRTQRKSD